MKDKLTQLRQTVHKTLDENPKGIFSLGILLRADIESELDFHMSPGRASGKELWLVKEKFKEFLIKTMKKNDSKLHMVAMAIFAGMVEAMVELDHVRVEIKDKNIVN